MKQPKNIKLERVGFLASARLQKTMSLLYAQELPDSSKLIGKRVELVKV